MQPSNRFLFDLNASQSRLRRLESEAHTARRQADLALEQLREAVQSAQALHRKLAEALAEAADVAGTIDDALARRSLALGDGTMQNVGAQNVGQ